MAPFFETQSQVWVFLGMMYLGLGLGLIYDILGFLRRSGKKGWTVGADLLFFLLAGAALTLALVKTGQEGLRLYALLGLACGGMIYLLGLRRLMIGTAAFFSRHVGEPVKAAMVRAKERKEHRNSVRGGRKQA